MKRTVNPKWNSPMQFLLYNLLEDTIHINLYDNEFFSPNGLFLHKNRLFSIFFGFSI